MTETVTDTAPATADTAPAGDATTQTNDTQTTTTTDGDNGDATAQADDNRASINDGSQTDFTLPDEYKEKTWAGKIKSQEDAYKQIDNLTELIGKKTIKPINYEEATPEEIAAHHSSLAPEDVKDYGLTDGDGDPAFAEAVGGIFQKYGVDKYQAKGLAGEINAVAAKMVEEKTKADTSEEGYMKLMEESFGEDYKEQAGIVEKSLKEHAASDDDRKALDELDNTQRALVDRTVHSLTKHYETRIKTLLKEHGITETSAQVEADKGSNSGVDINEVRSDLRNKMAELGTRQHTAQELQVLKDKLDATYK